MKMNKLPLRRKLVFKSIKNMCRILLKKARCGGIGLFWLGWRDSNPRDAGVKVLCLTAWRQPNIRKICFRDLVKVPIAKTMGTLNYFVGWGVGFEPTVFRATI